MKKSAWKRQLPTVSLAAETFEDRALLSAFTWNGSVSTDWETAGNWTVSGAADADGIPDTDDAVTIDSGTTFSPQLSAPEAIGSLSGSIGTPATIDLQSFTLTVGALNSDTDYGGHIVGSGGITKDGSGTFRLSGSNTYSGATTINSGILSTSSSSSNLGDGSVTNSVIFNGGFLRMGGFVSLSTRPFVLQADATIQDLGTNNEIAGVISGAFDLTKAHDGRLTLSAVNTFGGVGHKITLTGGQIIVAADSGLGATDNEVVFNGGTTLVATTSFATARSIVLTQSGILDAKDSAVFTIDGVVSGTGTALGIQSSGTGAGTVFLTNGSNFYTGVTNVTSGSLTVTTNGARGGTTNGLTTVAGTVVDFPNVLYTFAEPITLSSATLNVSTGTSSLAGPINISATSTISVPETKLTIDGVISNNAFTKTGSGTLVLTAVNTYTGTTTVSAGTLLVDGSTAAGASFTVNSGATLGGSGAISSGAMVSISGRLAPGGSPESLNIGSASLATGAFVDIEIGGTTPGTGYDQLIASNTVILGGSTLTLTAINGFVPSAGQNYTIIDNQGVSAINGTFSGLAEGALIGNFLGSGNAAYITYVGGDGNDVVITTNTAPTLDASQSPALTRIDTDNQTSSGDTVASIVVDGSITDPDTVTDPESIAVTSVDNTNGKWQYSTDNGGSWNDFSATTGSNVDLSTASRLLLPTDRIRFVPNLTYVGTATFTFRAWDQTTGTAGSTASTTTNGGMTAFSSASDGASIFVGSIETSVALDGSGNLVVTDINGGTTDDTLTVKSDGANIYVSDPNRLLETSVGSISGDFHTVTIPLASITGSQLQFNTLAGSDSLTVDFSLGNFTKSIVYTAGNPTSAPGDSLTLTGGSTFTTVTHTFSSENDGTVDVSGNSQISYTGLEPVTDNLDATNRVFTFTGGAETITVTDTGGADGKTKIDSTLGESVTFTNPTASLTINAGSGDDTITISSVDSAFTAALTVNGDAGTDTINSNATLTLGSGSSTGAVSLTAETIAVTAAINTTAVTTGTTSLSGTTISLGANLSTDSASVTIAGSTSVSLTSSITIDTESGNNGNAGAVSFAGTVQLQPDGTKGRDLTINTATNFAGGTGGAVTLPTIGLNTTYLNDVSIDTRAATNGVITVGGNITTDDNGVASGGTITLAGDVRLSGSRTFSTADADTNGGVIDLSNATVSATVANANLTLTTESTKAGGTGGAVTLNTFSNAGGQLVNNLSIDTNGTTTTAGDITQNGTVTLAGSATYDGRTISLPNTQSDLIVSGSNTISLTATKNVSLGAGASLQSVNGNITVSANQQATATTGDFTGILLTAASIAASGTGSISLTGKGGTGASENDGVRITDDNTGGIGTLSTLSTTSGTISVTGTTNSTTAGDDGVHIEDATINASSAGPITINGTGANSSTSEGVYLAGATSFAKSNGGAITITGTTSGDDGVEISKADITNQSSGTITISGTGGTGSATADGVVIDGSGQTLISVANGNLQINGTGGKDDGIDASDAIIRTTGSGKLSLIGTGGSVAEGDGIVVTITGNGLGILSSSSGAIVLNGTATAGDGVELVAGAFQAIGATSTGTISITGDGNGAGTVGVQIDAPISANSGSVTITSQDDVTFAATGDVTTVGGAVTVIATNSGGKITQADGALIDAGNKQISLTADSTITLGGLLTTFSNTLTNAIAVTSNNGAIVDGGDSHVDAVAAAGIIALSAPSGIGTANAIETTGTRLSASSNNNDIRVTETDGIVALFLSAGTGDVFLTAGGAITDTDGSTDITADDASITISTAGAALGTSSNAVDVLLSTLVTSTNAADQYLSTSTTVTIGNGDLSSGAANTVHLVSGGWFTTSTGGDINGKAEVQGAAVLAGNGTVTGSVSTVSGAIIDPGISTAGVLTTGPIDFASGVTFNVEIDGNSPGIGAGFHDQLVTTGNVTINSATLTLTSLGYTPQDGDSYKIINNGGAGAVSGTFSGYPQGQITPNFLGSPYFMRIDYAGGDGNDVVLEIFSADTSVDIDGSGNLVITDINTTTNDALTISLNAAGTHYIITDPTRILTTSSAGLTGDGTNTITVPVASVTGVIQFVTLAGNDSITVDYTNGSFPDDMTIDGGTQTTSDSLTLQNATFTSITHSATSTGAGTIAFAGPANGGITYSALEAITDSLTVSDRTFNYSNTAQTISMTDAAAANGRTNITSTAGTPIDFTNPSLSFSLNGGTSDDTISVSAVDSGFVASISIDGGAGTDSITSSATLTLGTGNTGTVSMSAETVSMSAETITIDGAIDTTAGSTESISLTGGTITINAGLTTNIGDVVVSATGAISFTATGNITTTTGNVDVTSTGGTITQTDGSLIDAGSGEITLTADLSLIHI